jgi:bifunctional DNase/RNase
MKDAEGATLTLDARPSDAIALALRADCPIYVDEAVIHASRNSVSAEAPESLDEALEGDDEWPDVIGETGDLPM